MVCFGTGVPTMVCFGNGSPPRDVFRLVKDGKGFPVTWCVSVKDQDPPATILLGSWWCVSVRDDNVTTDHA